MWDHHWQEKWFCEAGWGKNNKSVEWKQIAAREKSKFKMKIMRGTKKLNWGKKMDGQNMWIQINYSIKSGDLICTNLMDKKWVL